MHSHAHELTALRRAMAYWKRDEVNPDVGRTIERPSAAALIHPAWLFIVLGRTRSGRQHAAAERAGPEATRAA
jgi:hypothetical protein